MTDVKPDVQSLMGTVAYYQGQLKAAQDKIARQEKIIESLQGFYAETREILEGVGRYCTCKTHRTIASSWQNRYRSEDQFTSEQYDKTLTCPNPWDLGGEGGKKNHISMEELVGSSVDKSSTVEESK